eukprot:CAMPEP_0194394748 /NCGR_PEP_ID=MMETSP0174-20130528/124030_1 /TAXON_ID=216777 /ORGANISM="Proboscia alata, Strain PI-D3" /LENGTH=207 /DNA_ID=CAMNT_0039190587 /DNA_START=504 /DNA_END=1127 /DNA_ORIENTATION=-
MVLAQLKNALNAHDAALFTIQRDLHKTCTTGIARTKTITVVPFVGQSLNQHRRRQQKNIHSGENEEGTTFESDGKWDHQIIMNVVKLGDVYMEPQHPTKVMDAREKNEQKSQNIPEFPSREINLYIPIMAKNSELVLLDLAGEQLDSTGNRKKEGEFICNRVVGILVVKIQKAKNWSCLSVSKQDSVALMAMVCPLANVISNNRNND